MNETINLASIRSNERLAAFIARIPSITIPSVYGRAIGIAVFHDQIMRRYGREYIDRLTKLASASGHDLFDLVMLDIKSIEELEQRAYGESS